MNRRSFLAGAAAGGAISVLDWMGWFRRNGVPGGLKDLGIASAVAQTAPDPHFLIYWFLEGGWDSYSMFSPVVTPNDAATLNYSNGQLNPSPSWTNQIYRPNHYGQDAAHYTAKTTGNITHGFLAEDGRSLMPDMAVVSSHDGHPSHSTGRWYYHYGRYSSYETISAMRAPTERTVLQAFCEAYGASLPLAHVSWHRWLSDGELSEPSYPEGTGYYDRLGPTYAHTNYGKTPAELRNRLSSLTGLLEGAQAARVRGFVDNLHSNFVKDKNSESVRAFDSAVKIHRQLTGGTSVVVNPATMFNDATLRSEFDITPDDELTNSQTVNGNPARSKNCPNTNVQAMMTYELMTKGISCGFWIESRDIRGFDDHSLRSTVLNNHGQVDQLDKMRTNLWSPLKALVARLKNTQYQQTGKSYWDFATIALTSEMGRTINGDVESILSSGDSNGSKYQQIMDQDCSAHWNVNSMAFLGGNVAGNRQWGKVGSTTLEAIPTLPSGALDPAYDAVTGVLKPGMTKSAASFISDPGHAYSTALYLAGLDPVALKAAGKGLNSRPPLTFIKK